MWTKIPFVEQYSTNSGKVHFKWKMAEMLEPIDEPPPLVLPKVPERERKIQTHKRYLSEYPSSAIGQQPLSILGLLQAQNVTNSQRDKVRSIHLKLWIAKNYLTVKYWVGSVHGDGAPSVFENRLSEQLRSSRPKTVFDLQMAPALRACLAELEMHRIPFWVNVHSKSDQGEFVFWLLTLRTWRYYFCSFGSTPSSITRLAVALPKDKSFEDALGIGQNRITYESNLVFAVVYDMLSPSGLAIVYQIQGAEPSEFWKEGITKQDVQRLSLA